MALLPGSVCLTSATAGYSLKSTEENHEKVVQKYEVITERLTDALQKSDSMYAVLLAAAPSDPVPCIKQPCDAVPCIQMPCKEVPCLPDTVYKTDTVIKPHFLKDKPLY
jgi:hypothetical protein